MPLNKPLHPVAGQTTVAALHPVAGQTIVAALQCRLQEAELSEQAVAAVVKLSRDPHIPTKLAAAKATGNLLLAELDGHVPEGCAMEPLVPVLIALLGRDQNSEVQRQGLQASWLTPLMHQVSVESDTCFATPFSALCASLLKNNFPFHILCMPLSCTVRLL